MERLNLEEQLSHSKCENLLNTLLKENTFQTKFPKSHKELFLQELAYYTFCLATPNIPVKNGHGQINLMTLILQGQIELIPQTYNDFLAASAAGIFTSNLTSGTQNILTTTPMPLTQNKKILEVAMEKNICDRHTFHQKEQLESFNKILKQLQNSED